MGDVDKLNPERACFDDLLRLDCLQPRLVSHFVLFETALHQRQRERGAINRHVKISQKIRNRADVVFMGMRQE